MLCFVFSQESSVFILIYFFLYYYLVLTSILGTNITCVSGMESEQNQVVRYRTDGRPMHNRGIALLRHRTITIVIARSHHRSIDPDLTGAIVKYVALSGFHRQESYVIIFKMIPKTIYFMKCIFKCDLNTMCFSYY